jgi:hypothetical protein
MEEFTHLLCGWLITFGFSFAMAVTDGPFAVFSWFRKKVALKAKWAWIRTGVNCPVCLSCWIGIVVSVLMNGGVVMWASAIGFTCVITSLSPEGSE